MNATPELMELLSAMLRSAPPGGELTLGDARRGLLEGIVWSDEGELLYGQDTTSFVLELDELIDRYGMDQPVQQVVDETAA